MHRRLGVISLATVVAALGIGLPLRAALNEPKPDPSPAAQGSPGPVDPWMWGNLEAGWTELAPPPMVRARAVAVWTGRYLVYWGGDTGYGGTFHGDGAMYDPAADAWTALPESPLGSGGAAWGVWTGTETVIVSGEAGAALDPMDRTWRPIAPAPEDLGNAVAAVWSGTEVIAWGNRTRAADPGSHHGAAYDPSTDRWRTIAEAPQQLNVAQGVWTGRELIVVGARQDDNNWARTPTAVGLAYSPTSDSWRELPPTRLSPQASTITWTGHHVLAWDYGLRAQLYDPEADAWVDAPDLPLQPMECYPRNAAAGTSVLGSYCGAAAVFDIGTQTWETVEVPPKVIAWPVSAGAVVLFAGASHEGCCNALWAYRPPERETAATATPCAFPTFTPTYLPWIDPGERIPEPRRSRLPGGGPQGLDPAYAEVAWHDQDDGTPEQPGGTAYAVLWRSTEPVDPTPPDPDVPPLPDGSLGKLYAGSSDDSGDWAIIWADASSNTHGDTCSETTLSVSLPDHSPAEGRAEILRIARSLQPVGDSGDG